VVVFVCVGWGLSSVFVVCGRGWSCDTKKVGMRREVGGMFDNNKANRNKSAVCLFFSCQQMDSRSRPRIYKKVQR
jgi:hypothetical protein